MTIAVRLASLADEQEQLIEILDRNLPGRPNRRIQEMRHANPMGPGWSWVGQKQGSDKIVAMASVVPRPFWVNGERVLCGQVVEFAVDAAYRSLGPAVALQKATFEPINSGAVAFGYDCPPHDRGMSTFIRLGMQSTTEVVRYALLFRSDEYVTKRLGSGVWTKPIVAAANLALGRRRSKVAPLRGLEIAEFEKPFEEEFTQLDRVIPSQGIIRATRAAPDLNWRYVRTPSEENISSRTNLGRYRVLVARQAGELVAYAVLFVHSDGSAWLADFFGRDLIHSGAYLLEAVIDSCRRERVVRLDALCSADSELQPLYEAAGFRARETAYRVVAYEDPRSKPGRLDPALHWRFTSFEASW